jgi:hypothetical protein
MSVLEVPRILFRGAVTWDPIVTNNYDTFYDEGTGETVLPNAANKVKAFRHQAIDSVTGMGGNWNPHGTHRAGFYGTSVSGVDLGSNVVTTDPFVTAAVQFTGMLVDLEPFGAFSSQLFFNAMTVGVDGGYRIHAPRSARVTARYINFARNPANNMIAGVASVVWQTSFAKLDGLRIDGFDSPALQALVEALRPDDVLGLTVRFSAYRTIYFDDPTLSNRSAPANLQYQSLQSKLKAGGFQPNPARSLLVGVMGLWRKDEPVHEPGERAMLPVGQSPLGAASARLSRNALTIDLANCVPEDSRDLTKMNLGPLRIVALDASAGAALLGTLTYDQYRRETYEAASGIVSIPLTPALAELAAEKDIGVTNESGTALLREQPLRAIPVVPNLYLDEGDRVAATFQVYERGRLATSAVPVTLSTMSADGGTIANSKVLTTDAAGVLAIPVTGASGGGIVAYVASPSGVDLPTGGINPQVNTYMYVRTRPADAGTGTLPPTWDNVYSKVLANWNAMAPCMDNWLKLDDPIQVKAHAGIIRELTDPAHFEDFRFMPVPRDMTIGQRTLLYNFLDEPVPHDALRPTVPQDLPHFAALSRSHRRA